MKSLANTSQIMTAANQKAKTEGRSKALKSTWKASRGVSVVGVGKVLTNRQKCILSPIKTGEETAEAVVDFETLDMAMF